MSEQQCEILKKIVNLFYVCENKFCLVIETRIENKNWRPNDCCRHETLATLYELKLLITKFISLIAWKMVIAENPYDVASDSGSTCSSQSSTSSTYSYYVDQPSPLTDFKPFDLESWWGRRLFQNITKSL
jgi:hypothetical protein